MIVLGLTGSIAMGKSETAKIFRSLGIAVFDSDAEVHELYAANGEAVEPLTRLAPEAIVDAAVDRQKLSGLITATPSLLAKIEAIVHPLVRKRQLVFLEKCRKSGEDIAVLDIPLLLEKGSADLVDKIVVVSAPAELQRQRALARAGMTEEKLDMILARQMPDDEKRRRADYVIDTSKSVDDARTQVISILADIRASARTTP